MDNPQKAMDGPTRDLRDGWRGLIPVRMPRWLGWGVVALVFLIPVWSARHALDVSHANLTLPVSVMALVVCVCALCALLRRYWVPRLMVLAVLLALIAIRLFFWGLVQFSGSGYTTEVFAHLEWQSVEVAWQGFRGMLLLAAAGIVLLAGGLARLMQQSAPAWSLRKATSVLVFAVLALGLTRTATPEWQMVQAWRAWSLPVNVDVDAAVLQRWQDTGWISTRIAPTDQVTARAAATPKNLVLLYLESVGSSLVEHPSWPGLMPNLQRLVRDHSLVGDVYGSGYVTIEGIVNSQCGSLLPLAGGSGFADGDALADRLPCLGDVLHRAGYEQVYLGGADLSFAGKGRFLSAHGFGTLKGIRHWREIGLDQRPGDWGLSDVDLFDQSIQELEALQAAGKPFNLTMLTIGTHVPGYPYAECAPYANSKQVFLHAVHCTDQLVGRWLQQAQTRGLLRDTVVVITADHPVFPNPTMEQLFGDAVKDRRVPLVVIDGDTPLSAPARAGAGYDLAPTVLDLLQVDHSAEFVLGRSLLRVQDRPDYFVRRYLDVQDGKDVFNAVHCTATQGPPVLPLDRCAKDELLATLAALARSYTSASTHVTCAEPPRIHVPFQSPESVSFVVGGLEQIDRFTWKGRNLPDAADGLFLLFATDAGEIVKRRYLPAASLADVDALPEWWADPWPESAQMAIVAWRAPDVLPEGELSAPPLLTDWQLDHSGVWLLQAPLTAANPAVVASVVDMSDVVMEISAKQCQQWMTAP